MPTPPEYSDHISQIVQNHRYSNGPGGEEIVEAWKAYGLIPKTGGMVPLRLSVLDSGVLYLASGNAQGGYPYAGSGPPIDPSLGLANGNFDVSPAGESDVLTQATDKWGIYRGLVHPQYPDLYLDEYTAVPLGGSLAQANIIGTFRTIGLPAGDDVFGNRRWLVSFKTSSTVMNTKTSYGWYFDSASGTKKYGLISVGYYNNNAVNPATDYPMPLITVHPPNPDAQNQYQYQYVQMDGLESIITWEWTYNQISFAVPTTALQTVSGIVNTYNGVLNTSTMFTANYDPFTVRTRVIASSVTPRRNMLIPDPDTGLLMYLQQVKYILEYRKRGWREVCTFKYPQTGFEPEDVSQPGLHILNPLTNPAVFAIPGGSANPDALSGNGWICTQPIQDMDLNALGLADPGSF